MIRRIKNALRRRRLAQAGVAVDLRCPTAQYGTGGGQWTVCPDAIGPDPVVYSFGIGRDLSFDRALIDRHGGTVHAFDPTPLSVEWVHSQVLPRNLAFHEIGIAGHDGCLEFRAPRKATSVHFTPVKRYRRDAGNAIVAPVRKLSTLMHELGHGRLDILKLDIEGGEYEVIDDIVSQTLPVNQLLVEFHHSYETIPFKKTVEAVNALRRAGLRVFAISDRSYEVSLIRPSRA